jgi:hypothetical protein
MYVVVLWGVLKLCAPKKSQHRTQINNSNLSFLPIRCFDQISISSLLSLVYIARLLHFHLSLSSITIRYHD